MANNNGKKKKKKSKAQRRSELQTLVLTTAVATSVAAVVSFYVNRSLAKREREASADAQRTLLGAMNNPRLAALGAGNPADYSNVIALPGMGAPAAMGAANGNPSCPRCETKDELARELETLFGD